MIIEGKKRARVENVEEPNGLLKCQIRLIGLWDDVPLENLPWAEYELPVGSRFNDGDFSPCQKGDYVWVRFDEGDSRYPIITGSCYFAPEGVPNLPHEVFGGDESYEHKRTDAQPKPSQASKEDRISTQHNFLVELTHEGAYRVTHKASGTAIEITKDGELVLHCEKDGFSSTKGHQHNEVIGMFKHEVGENYALDVGKELKITVKGNAIFEVDGDFDVAKANLVNLLQGAGVVTGECICAYTGSPHSDASSKVFASK